LEKIFPEKKYLLVGKVGAGVVIKNSLILIAAPGWLLHELRFKP
jgi:hypothetical protein